ncbi:phosphoribosylanthranilate isomerase [Rhodoblastus sphagnicola]|nr:phosphoribosylanthranilate isomerase [Rhodoblastus sphagnicola]
MHKARELSALLAGRAQKVALVVDPEDVQIEEIVQELRPDWLQLHGAESPERVADLRKKFGIPILKAIGVAEPEDLARADAYSGVADRLLLDAKPPKGGGLPGGNGLAFDWTLAKGFSARTGSANWLLSGGLSPDNVGQAIGLTGAPGVDVSSGVEDSPGKKSVEKIRAFIAAVRHAQDQLGLATRSV